MSTITSEQFRTIAVILIEISSELKLKAGEIQFTNPSEFDRLMNSQQNILILSQKIISEAVDITISDENLENAKERIIESTKKVKSAFKTIENIQKILSIATAIINLATSLITGFSTGGLVGIGSTVKSIEDLLDTIDDDN